jgi:hypothetical protein
MGLIGQIGNEINFVMTSECGAVTMGKEEGYWRRYCDSIGLAEDRTLC